jgi:aromatic ring-opening dioxygenase catalytic subunit (LigB family)
MWDGLAAYLRGIDASLGARPKAVLVISGHWETTQLTVNVAERPKLLFDYYGFPEHTYRLKYPVPGAPDLEPRVRALLADAGFELEVDSKRGLDHGVFVPFLLVYPNADVPIMQLSLLQSLDPMTHIAIGRGGGHPPAGRGMSYHTLAAMFSGRGAEASLSFDAWLAEAISDPKSRDEKLAEWRNAPGGRESHPRAEHLIPLMVAAGAADGDPGVRNFAEAIAGKSISGFQFG